ncbi:hypothetical protein FQA47_011642 [Oryzias melastigma]|uniref:Uncharacterized protein n=1 Tax=Oryzias melastigma TaxID=30732 RepID=A0A834CJD4_ORYME|nr:hypothetical protein FQA47_011642 [Oryzias melastigma]
MIQLNHVMISAGRRKTKLYLHTTLKTTRYSASLDPLITDHDQLFTLNSVNSLAYTLLATEQECSGTETWIYRNLQGPELRRSRTTDPTDSGVPSGSGSTRTSDLTESHAGLNHQ